MTPIDIACAADDGYAPHLAAMLQSMFASNPGTAFRVHYLHRAELNPDTARKLEGLCQRHGARLLSVSVPRTLIAGIQTQHRYSEEAWYRLVLPTVLPELGRVLWLDADVLVLHSLRELWEVDLEGRPLAAVPNALGPRHRKHLAKLGMSGDPAEYFNTGVMVLDLGSFRANGIEGRLRERALHNDHNVFADQDVFSPVLSGNFRRLPLAWNVTAGAYLHVAEAVRLHGLGPYRQALDHPRIVHFTQQKPWRYASGHPYRDLYLKFRAAAGWPPPQHEPATFRSRIGRRLPMMLRALLTTPDQLTAADILMRLRVWLVRF